MNKNIFDDIHQYLEITYIYKDSDIFLTLYDQILLDKIIKYNIDELKIVAGSLVPESSKICQEYLIQKNQSKIAYNLLRTLAKNSKQEKLTQDNLEWIIDEGRDTLKIELINNNFPLTENQIIFLIQGGSEEILLSIARNRSQSEKIINLLMKQPSSSLQVALIESGVLSIYWCQLLMRETNGNTKNKLYEYITKKMKEENPEIATQFKSLREALTPYVFNENEKIT